MSINTESLFAACAALPEEERLALVNRLLETIPVDGKYWFEDDPEFEAELRRRSADNSELIP